MLDTADRERHWPELPYLQWRDTIATLQLWTQIAGKVRLELSPWLNHSWQVPLYVNARGLGTGPIHSSARIFEIDFDFVDHLVILNTPDSAARGFALEPMPVAAFYRRLMAALAGAGIDVTINTLPSEIANPIRFEDDQLHASYDASMVNAFWRALVQIDRVFKQFRTGFLGKCSPVHFFWGSFDLAVTRFSGRKAPLHPGGVPGLPDAVAREAYSHEVSSAGFWPGNEVHPHAAFFAYAYPAPQGFAEAKVEPAEAAWSTTLSEWLLPYDALRNAVDPDAALLRFLETTYRAAADLAHWDPELDCRIGVPGHPRAV
jgi:hypothetical protein